MLDTEDILEDVVHLVRRDEMFMATVPVGKGIAGGGATQALMGEEVWQVWLALLREKRPC